MKKVMKGILLLLIGIIVFSCGKQKESAKNERVFVIGTNAEYPPFEYLENKKYGAELGTTKEATAKSIAGTTVVPYQNNTSALLALKNGQIDGIVLDESVAYEYVKNNSELSLVGVLEGEPKAIALSKNDKDYEKINAALLELIKEGKIEELKKKYNLN